MSSPKAVMRSALDQWLVVRQVKDAVREVLTVGAQEDIDASTGKCAEGSMNTLKEARAHRNGSPGCPEYVGYEEQLLAVLKRLKDENSECENGEVTPTI